MEEVRYPRFRAQDRTWRRPPDYPWLGCGNRTWVLLAGELRPDEGACLLPFTSDILWISFSRCLSAAQWRRSSPFYHG